MVQSKREQFDAAVAHIRSKKKHGVLMEKSKRDKIIDALRATSAESSSKCKLSEVYNWQSKYTLTMTGDENVLMKKGKIIAVFEEVYDILQDSHLRTGHGGRDILLNEISQNYANITREYVMEFLKLCQECELKKGKARKS